MPFPPARERGKNIPQIPRTFRLKTQYIYADGKQNIYTYIYIYACQIGSSAIVKLERKHLKS